MTIVGILWFGILLCFCSDLWTLGKLFLLSTKHTQQANWFWFANHSTTFLLTAEVLVKFPFPRILILSTVSEVTWVEWQCLRNEACISTFRFLSIVWFCNSSFCPGSYKLFFLRLSKYWLISQYMQHTRVL